MARITEEQKAFALKIVKEHGNNVHAAARACKVPRKTLERHYQEALRNDNPTTGTERLMYEDRIRSLEKRLRERDAVDLDAEKISQYYFGLKNKPPEEPTWLLPSRRKASGVVGVPVATWSDWHYSEVVEPSQVEGANEFNIAVFDRRYKVLVERTIDLCFNHMTVAGKYSGIVVNLGGDMISGDIHEELADTNEADSIPAVLDLSGKIIWGLRALADKFGNVFVTGVAGNHGRNTRKPRAKNMCFTSFDWMIYKIVEKALETDKRFQFFIPNGFDAYYRVYGHRVLLTHGDRIGSRGGDGFIGAIGPIMRGAHKLRLSYAARGREVDTLIMGHWHNEITLPGLRVNNALKGYDEWAMSMRFTPTPPSQDLFFIHPQRGVTCSWPIQLEGPQHGAEGDGWVSWKAKAA